MSSIFGKINFNKKPVELSELAAMETALNHWGADDKGQWQNGFAGLGQLMLYNTPESLHEKLPLFNNLSGLTITADARIDNRDELFTKLYTGNPDKATIPDSTLILTAYEKYGEACVQHLIGDFAFAIWDEREQKLFCARDHMGVKPFFYYCDENFFAFASEKKGILCLRGVDKTIDEQFFYNQLVVLSLQAVDTTLYKKIRRVPPANTVTISPGKPIPRLNKYWELDATLENKLGSKNEYIEGLLHHFEQAVRCRTRSAYTVGAELSGGMDSSAITGVADVFLKQQGRHLVTFSNTLPAGVTDEELVKSDEREYMDAVIAFNDIKDYVYVTQKIWDDPLDEIDFLLRVNDGLERFNPGWELPSKKAAMERGVRTMLSGFPGDQMITTRAKGYFLDLLDKKKYKEYLLAPKRFESRFHKIRPFIPGSLIYGVLDVLDSLGFYQKKVRASAGIFNIPAVFKRQYKNIIWHDPVYRDIYNGYRHSQKYTLNQPLVSQRMEGENRFGLYFKLESRFP
ncbi:MAG: asparagine synthase-related protein, partial [Mucilaginibacter sp.]